MFGLLLASCMHRSRLLYLHMELPQVCLVLAKVSSKQPHAGVDYAFNTNKGQPATIHILCALSVSSQTLHVVVCVCVFERYVWIYSVCKLRMYMQLVFAQCTVTCPHTFRCIESGVGVIAPMLLRAFIDVCFVCQIDYRLQFNKSRNVQKTMRRQEVCLLGSVCLFHLREYIGHLYWMLLIMK